MAVYWRLKDALAAQGIPGSAELHRALRDTLGLQISQQALAKLIRKPPESVKMQTAQMLCTLLQVPLQDYLVITPEPKLKSGNIIQPYRPKPQDMESIFVDPSRFL